MKKRFSIHNSAGDTIVEVLVVLAVLSLAFAISYATANHALVQSRNAEEHSEALGLLNTQVELLRAAYTHNISTVPRNGTYFCMTAAPVNPVLGFSPGYPTPTATFDNFTKYPSECKNNAFNNGGYNWSIDFKLGTDAFDLRVRWDGIGKQGRQQEELTYKISAFSLASGAPYNNPP